MAGKAKNSEIEVQVETVEAETVETQVVKSAPRKLTASSYEIDESQLKRSVKLRRSIDRETGKAISPFYTSKKGNKLVKLALSKMDKKTLLEVERVLFIASQEEYYEYEEELKRGEVLPIFSSYTEYSEGDTLEWDEDETASVDFIQGNFRYFDYV